MTKIDPEVIAGLDSMIAREGLDIRMWACASLPEHMRQQAITNAVAMSDVDFRNLLIEGLLSFGVTVEKLNASKGRLQDILKRDTN